MEGLYEKDCALCLRSFQYCKIEASEDEMIDKLEIACSAYIKTDIAISDCNWDHLWMQDNPLCPDCNDRATNLWSLDDRLQQIEKDLKEFVTLFCEEILAYRKEKKSGEPDNVSQEVSLAEDVSTNVEFNDSLDALDTNGQSDEVTSFIPDLLLSDEDQEKDINPAIKEEIPSHSDDSTSVADSKMPDIQHLQDFPGRKCRPKRKAAVKSGFSKRKNSSSSERGNSDGSLDLENIVSKPKISKRSPKKNGKKSFGKNNSKNHICKTCNASLPSQEALLVHNRTHKGRTWKCEICDENFFRVIVSRKRHMKIVHPEIEQIDGVKVCEICGERFEGSVNSYELHGLVHKGEIPFECQLCHLKYFNAPSYTDHFRFSSCGTTGLKETAQSSFKCDLCGKVFKVKFLLLTHRLSHTNCYKTRIINCEICGKEFPVTPRGTFSVERHFISHTKEIPFPCDICGRRYAHVYSLEQHRLTHKGKQSMCDICGHSFLNPDGVYRHKKYMHSDSEKKRLREENQRQKKMKLELKKAATRTAMCDHCGKGFVNQRGLLRHKLLIHGQEIPEDIDYKTGDTRNKEKFRCEICDVEFVRKFNYEKHVKSHTEENPLECINENCKQKFKVFFDLNEHYNTSPECKAVKDAKNEKYKFVCRICGRRERSNVSLRQHERTHTGEKPFQCDLCERSFVRNYRLKEHRLKHDESYADNPFSCRSCPFKCKTRKDILVHYKSSPICQSKVQETKKHSCDDCGKRFYTKLRLLSHRADIHTPEGLRKTLPKPFQCEVCGMGFSFNHKLVRHRKKHLKELA